MNADEAEWIDAVELLSLAVRCWHREHPEARPAFVLPRGSWLFGFLADFVDGMCANDEARELVAMLLEARPKTTIMQAVHALESVPAYQVDRRRALERSLSRKGG